MPPPPEPRPMPEGTVTFLFSDLEGSTKLLESYGAAAGVALERHHRLFEELVDRNHGVIFETVGDAVYAAFSSPADGVAAALDAHRALAADSWSEVGGRLACRISLHTGVVEVRGSHYFGAPLFRAARLQALAYGEQTVVSAATAALVSGHLPAGAQLIDRGVHRLKDLQEPEHVFELQHPDLRTEFPPLKSLDARPHNLPVQLSSFVGRDQELAAVGAQIVGHRLVTLLGPGGIGKTRLALQVAADQIDQFPDGAWFVDLAATSEAGDIPDAIASAMGLRDASDRAASELVRDHLRGKTLLLLLDNLEHLLPMAAGSVSELLAGAPNLHVLATSRAPLRLRGETEVPVASLSAGHTDMLDERVPSAVALFLARAKEVRPALELTSDVGPLIAAICNRLDGLPLAIELAAARLRLFTLEQLHDRLETRLDTLTGGARDLPERQQTLQATVAWSEELLSQTERELFYRLGIFVGSFSLDGAVAIAAPEHAAAAEADLTTLLEQSLVRRSDNAADGRFAMLETIREFASTRLRAAGLSDDAMSHMADHLIGITNRAWDEFFGPHQAAILAQLDAELPNIRQAIPWLAEREQHERLAVLTLGMARYWGRRGLRREGQRWVAIAAQHVADDDTEFRAKLYSAEGSLFSDLDPQRAAAAHERAVAIYRKLDRPDGLARCLLAMSAAHYALRDADRAEASAEEARAIARRVDDKWIEAAAISSLFGVAMLRGQLDQAEELLGTANELMRNIGDFRGASVGLLNLGAIAQLRGDMASATDYYRRAIEAADDLDDPHLRAFALPNYALLVGQAGHSRQGLGLIAGGIEGLLEVGDLGALIDAVSIAASLLSACGDVDGAARGFAYVTTHDGGPGAALEQLDRAALDAVKEKLGARYEEVEREVEPMTLEEFARQMVDRVNTVVRAADAPVAHTVGQGDAHNDQ